MLKELTHEEFDKMILRTPWRTPVLVDNDTLDIAWPNYWSHWPTRQCHQLWWVGKSTCAKIRGVKQRISSSVD
ncbi:hypothetical protein KIN20_011238 [Parelaphostrongylus tenuis]|uniref:Uncharacterized protein n=1 Tax=Parelaphostrongylus tenuis TaxID=148309 RepID=A0AAD5MAQ1_PARTN|nr:hypothetical protein KIN20_011238 [Parelaphostrongylus tenuis]